MSIGIDNISVYFPGDPCPIEERAQRLEVDLDFVYEKIGFRNIYKSSGESLVVDLSEKVVRQVLRDSEIGIDDVQCLFLVTQNPDLGGLPHSSAFLHERLGLNESCAIMDISLGCSGFVQGLAVISAFMEQNEMSAGILVTCDPYSRIVDPDDRNTALLFSDAATATLLTRSGRFKYVAGDFGAHGNSSGALKVSNNHLLNMNGRIVFDFAMKVVPGSVDRVLRKMGLEKQEIDAFLFHQGSKFIVEQLAKRLSIEKKAVFNAGSVGNTISSSIPIMLAPYLSSPVKSILLSGFGVGLCWATCLLRVKDVD